MEQGRRSFFQSLIGAGAAVSQPTGRHGKHPERDATELIYIGPMTIPAHVAEIVREDPNIAFSGAKHGKGHLVMRYRDEIGVWKFRCPIPESREMVGDIRRAMDGHFVICCWSVAHGVRPNCEPEQMIARTAMRLNA